MRRKEWILPFLNTEIFSRVLQDFADHFGVGNDKQIILPLDQAGWHTSEQVQVPEGKHKVFLPAYSPELQRAIAVVAIGERAVSQGSV